MNTGGAFLGMLMAGFFTLLPTANAVGPQLKPCEAELSNFSCKSTTDADANLCLKQHEKRKAKYHGYSEACFKAHEAYKKTVSTQQIEDRNQRHLGDQTG